MSKSSDVIACNAGH